MLFRPENYRKAQYITTPQLDTLLTYGATRSEISDDVLIKFPEQARQWLDDNGFAIFKLNSKSIADLIAEGLLVNESWGATYHQIIDQHARGTEIALDLVNPFLKSSVELTLHEQQAIVRLYSANLKLEMRGIKAIMGSAADYAEVVAELQQRHGIRLFGSIYDFDFARTSTTLYDGSSVIIGSNSPGYGLCIRDFEAQTGGPKISATPILVPTLPTEVMRF